jgi:hypothetical protein
MGARLLFSLIGTIEALAGAEATKNVVILLHCNEEQENDVVAELQARNFCG